MTINYIKHTGKFPNYFRGDVKLFSAELVNMQLILHFHSIKVQDCHREPLKIPKGIPVPDIEFILLII